MLLYPTSDIPVQPHTEGHAATDINRSIVKHDPTTIQHNISQKKSEWNTTKNRQKQPCVVLSSIVTSSHVRLICSNENCRSIRFTHANFFYLLPWMYTWYHDLVEVRYTRAQYHQGYCAHLTQVYTCQIIFSSLLMARRCLRSRRRVPDACKVYESAILSQTILKIKSHSIAYGSNSHRLKASRTRIQITQRIWVIWSTVHQL